MRKIVASALIMGLAGLSLAACGQNTPADKNTPKPAAQAATPDAALKKLTHADEDQQGQTDLEMLAQKLAKSSFDLATKAQQTPFGDPAVPEDFAKGVTKFVEMAHSTSQMLRASGGPADLACIYRGMSNDARDTLARLQAAQHPSGQLADYKRMNALFKDVFEVQNGGGGTQWRGGTCAAEPPDKWDQK